MKLKLSFQLFSISWQSDKEEKLKLALVTTDKEKAESLNNFLALVFSNNCLSHSPQMISLEEGDWGSNAPPVVSKDQVCDHLRNPNIHKSVGPDEMQPRVLRELAHITAKPPSMVFEKSWQSGEILITGKKGSIAPVFKKGRKDNQRNYQPFSITPAPGKVMDRSDLPRSYVKSYVREGDGMG